MMLPSGWPLFRFGSPGAPDHVSYPSQLYQLKTLSTSARMRSVDLLANTNSFCSARSSWRNTFALNWSNTQLLKPPRQFWPYLGSPVASVNLADPLKPHGKSNIPVDTRRCLYTPPERF